MNRLLFIITFLVATLSLRAQGLAETAKQNYQAGKYDLALPMYKQLYSKFPTSNTYGQRYAVCLLKTNTNLDEAIAHLTTTTKHGMNDSYLYLGECFAKQYYFQFALDNYQVYITKSRPRGEEEAEVNKQIQYASTQLEWLNKIEKVQIFDTITVPMEEFYKYYRLSKEVGNLTSEIPIDLGKAVGPAFINEKGTRMVYTTTNGSQLDLVQACKFVDSWEQEEKLDTLINSSEDESYPFMLADGRTLYFCSKGHNSMGGYDIFTTRVNPATGRYYPPVNLGFPYNSPDDDLLFVVDEFNHRGQFASTRRCAPGMITIYSFIPAKEKSYVNSTDVDYLAKKAQLITDSSDWVPAPSIPVDTVSSGEFGAFYFPIKDHVVYHQESDFRSFSALQKYLKAQEEIKALQWIRDELSKERALVNENKPYDKDKILRMEAQIPEKTAAIKQMLQDARLDELSKLQ